MQIYCLKFLLVAELFEIFANKNVIAHLSDFFT